MANKNKSPSIQIEATTLGLIILGLAWFGIYYGINGKLPECSINLNFITPITFLAIGGIGSNIRAWFNRNLR